MTAPDKEKHAQKGRVRLFLLNRAHPGDLYLC